MTGRGARRAFVALQFALPKHALSRTIGWLARREWGPLTHSAIALFIRVFGVDMTEAIEPAASAYRSFNAFFTRALSDGARPMPSDEAVVTSPVDGTVSACGQLAAGTLLQAKGVSYRVLDLFDGDAELAARFSLGCFFTVYLAPYNYHRVHMPTTGRAVALRHVPGALFSVNAATTRGLPGLFCRNERTAVVFEGEHGDFALVMVGAMNVGSIELRLPTGHPFANRPAATSRAGQSHVLNELALGRGAEFGRFNMGSTVILLATPGVLRLDPTFAAGQPIKVGERLGEPA
ncbi:MAG: archaetidylserine decarboxylase [Gammaproteobacteria bacterium]